MVSTRRVAEIIAVGSELLLGGRLDTNSVMLTRTLAELGIEVRYKSVVGDDRADIVRALRVAGRRAAVVFITGGLGPTLDDCTRDAVARATKRPLYRHAAALRQLTAWFHARNRALSDKQLVQALIPRGGTVLKNEIGSAPGFLLRWGKITVVTLPGVPWEAQVMFEHEVVPHLRRRARGARTVLRRTLQTYGWPESEVEAKIVDLVPVESGLLLGTLASPYGVTIALTASDTMLRTGSRSPRKVKGSAAHAIDTIVESIRNRLGNLVIGDETETMEVVVGRALTARSMTLATAESCTGGLIGHRLTQVPGSSAYYYGGAVCYSNEAKMTWLGVDPTLIDQYGAVSAEVAGAMADGIQRRTQCTIGLSVTGIAGPGGATPTKPVGMVYVGLAMSDRPTATMAFHFHGPREVIKLRASQAALNWVRLVLCET